MRKTISKEWMGRRTDEVHAYLSPARTPIPSVITSFNPSAQWYIKFLDSVNLRCKVINLGAGVKRIVHVENICPHCKGKGTI